MMVFASALFTIIAPPVKASSATDTKYDLERAKATSNSPNAAPAAMRVGPFRMRRSSDATASAPINAPIPTARSEEHTSELQSRENLVCRLLLEKKKTHQTATTQFQHPTPPHPPHGDAS